MGKHWVECAVCIKSNVHKVGDAQHAISKKHLNNLANYNVLPVAWDARWDSGWALGLNAPAVMTIEEAQARWERG